MIAWLSGTVLEILSDEIILNTQGVGYQFTLGANQRTRLQVEVGKMLELPIYTSVKEDDIRLFGFESFDQRSLFTTLLSVNGVGPKAAMNLIDQMAVKEMIFAVHNEDFLPFTKVSGIGKKTAQRIIVDLQGKLDGFSELAGGEIHHLETGKSAAPKSQGMAKDAKSALVNLGYGDKEADKVIKKHIETDITLDELIRAALSDLIQK